jgi:hypothetical protein
MSVDEAPSGFTGAADSGPDSSFKSTTTATAADAATAVAAALWSLGVDGGEQRGDPAISTFAGAFLDPSLGDVTAAAAGKGVQSNAGAASGIWSRFGLTKKASWLESNRSGRSSCNQGIKIKKNRAKRAQKRHLSEIVNVLVIVCALVPLLHTISKFNGQT